MSNSQSQDSHCYFWSLCSGFSARSPMGRMFCFCCGVFAALIRIQALLTPQITVSARTSTRFGTHTIKHSATIPQHNSTATFTNCSVFSGHGRHYLFGLFERIWYCTRVSYRTIGGESQFDATLWYVPYYRTRMRALEYNTDKWRDLIVDF